METYTNGVPYNPAAVGITGGVLTGTNVPYDIAAGAVPVIKVSSGTMGNNGALSGITALGRTYSGGAWLYLPAGAVAAGVPAAAGFQWGVGSSTTAFTVYNSTWNGTGAPPIGVQTAFVTTGPGAFTGDTTEQGIAITVPAGAMGPNGYIEIVAVFSHTNSAGNKVPRLRLGGVGGTSYAGANALTTTVHAAVYAKVSNTGVQNAQVGTIGAAFGGLGTSTIAPATGSVDTSASTTVYISHTNAVATDNTVIESWHVRCKYGA
jgi:hypothetical protein